MWGDLSERAKNDWAAIERSDIEAFLANRPPNAGRCLSSTRQFFRWARKRKVLVDPTAGMTRPKRRAFGGQALTIPEQRRLVRRWKGRSRRPTKPSPDFSPAAVGGSSGRTRTRATSCSPYYVTHLLGPIGVPPRRLRETRLVDLNSIGPKGRLRSARHERRCWPTSQATVNEILLEQPQRQLLKARCVATAIVADRIKDNH